MAALTDTSGNGQHTKGVLSQNSRQLLSKEQISSSLEIRPVPRNAVIGDV